MVYWHDICKRDKEVANHSFNHIYIREESNGDVLDEEKKVIVLISILPM